MKKICTILCSVIFCCLTVSTASATVTGTGTFDLFGLENATIGNYGYGTSYTDPNTGETVPVNNYFGRISEHDSNYNNYSSIAYGLDPNSDYRGNGNYHTSSLTGQFHQDTGSEEFTMSAVSPDPNNMAASTSINFIGGASFSGNIYNFDFGYHYNFSGSKDSNDDVLSFIIQSEISYWNGTNRVYIYSDYGSQNLITDSDSNFRSNWVNLQNIDGGNFVGSIAFDYSSADFSHLEGFNPDQNWTIRWDFMAYGEDTAGGGQPSPVPEPATFILLGSGLAGLAFYRRKRK